MTKLKITHSNQKIAIVPLQEYTDLQEFKSKMENENTVCINERIGMFGRHTYYTSSSEKLNQVFEELKVLKAEEQDLNSEIMYLKKRIENFNKTGILQFIKKRYFTKKSKSMK